MSATVGAPTELAVHRGGARRMGFFTDTTVCIGCKACEVACKQWNDLPADGSQFKKGGSYDHTGELSAATWRHVRFVEMLEPSPQLQQEAKQALPGIPPAGELPDLVTMAESVGSQWLFMSESASTAQTQAASMHARRAR